MSQPLIAIGTIVLVNGEVTATIVGYGTYVGRIFPPFDGGEMHFGYVCRLGGDTRGVINGVYYHENGDQFDPRIFISTTLVHGDNIQVKE